MAKASKLVSKGGKLSSAKSKTGNPQCSKAMSDWVRNRKGGTVPPETFSILAKCRAQARQNKSAQAKQAAGKLATGRGTWQRSDAAAALLAKRAATRVTPRNMPTVTPRNAGNDFSLKQDSAVGKKAFAVENLGRGRTGTMFDMKRGDLPGQTSIFDKIKTVDTRAGTPAAPPKPANGALQKAKARIARNRRAGATDGASGARIAEARQAKVGAARELRDAKRQRRGAATKLEEVKARVDGKKAELEGLRSAAPDTLRSAVADTRKKLADTERATAKQDRANTRAERAEGKASRVKIAPKPAAAAPRPAAFSRSNPERDKLAAKLKEAHRTPDSDLRYDKLAALKFSRENVKAKATNNTGFTAAHKAKLETAFRKLDQKGANFVHVLDLRRQFPELSRPQFDAMLKESRLAGKFTMNTHEGMAGKKQTRAQKKASISEGGTRFSYVSLR